MKIVPTTIVPMDVPAARPRAVLFDWDNTLVDSWPTIHDALQQTLIAMGHPPWTLEESKTRVRLSLRDSFPALFGTRWEEARRIYMNPFKPFNPNRSPALAGASNRSTTCAGTAS